MTMKRRSCRSNTKPVLDVWDFDTNAKVKSRRELIGHSTVLALVVFVSLAVSPLPADAQKTLRMVGPEDVGGAWAEVIRLFHAAHPDIWIDYISGPWSTDKSQNMYA